MAHHPAHSAHGAASTPDALQPTGPLGPQDPALGTTDAHHANTPSTGAGLAGQPAGAAQMTTSGAAAGHVKPTPMDKIVGSVEKAIGKMEKNPDKVAAGEERATQGKAAVEQSRAAAGAPPPSF